MRVECEKWKYKAKEAKKCPFCGSNSISVSHRENRYLGQNGFGIKKIQMYSYCVCNKCHSRSKPIKYIGYACAPFEFYDENHLPVYSCGDKAIEEWNRRV